MFVKVSANWWPDYMFQQFSLTLSLNKLYRSHRKAPVYDHFASIKAYGMRWPISFENRNWTGLIWHTAMPSLNEWSRKGAHKKEDNKKLIEQRRGWGTTTGNERGCVYCSLGLKYVNKQINKSSGRVQQQPPKTDCSTLRSGEVIVF